MMVAITGGSGFIGRRLVRRHLDLGDRVRVLSRTGKRPVTNGAEFHQGNLSDAGAGLEAFVDGADVIYHCAAELYNEGRMHAVNVDGTRALLNAAAVRAGRFVYLSSVGVYGKPRSGDITELAPLAPHNVYEQSKVQAERLVQESHVPFAILRPSKVFGAGMPDPSIYAAIGLIDRGLFFHIGRPGASANYVAVDNVVLALQLCGRMTQALGQVFNLSDWSSYEDFFAAIAAGLGKNAPRLRLPEAPARWLARTFRAVPSMPLSAARIDGLTTRCRFSVERIQRDLGYAHVVSIREGLAELVGEWKARR